MLTSVTQAGKTRTNPLKYETLNRSTRATAYPRKRASVAAFRCEADRRADHHEHRGRADGVHVEQRVPKPAREDEDVGARGRRPLEPHRRQRRARRGRRCIEHRDEEDPAAEEHGREEPLLGRAIRAVHGRDEPEKRDTRERDEIEPDNRQGPHPPVQVPGGDLRGGAAPGRLRVEQHHGGDEEAGEDEPRNAGRGGARSSRSRRAASAARADHARDWRRSRPSP